MNSVMLEEILNYKFTDENLCKRALTHSSYANESGVESYERLEFLGDAILEMVVSDYIYTNFKFDAGTSSKLRASLVSTDYLYNVVTKLGIDALVLKSKSLPKLSKKNTADIFESLIGAVYLDSGLSGASDVIYKHVIVDTNNINYILKNSIDYKSNLQEYLQKVGKCFEYKLVSANGLDHSKTFEVSLIVDGEVVATDKGTSIRVAEEKVAEAYLKSL